MKHKGCKFEYGTERDKELLRAYREQIGKCSVIVPSEICKAVVEMPAKRFWVSDERAAIVIARMFKGDRLTDMRNNTREMYYEIFRRVKELKKKRPAMTIIGAVSYVVSRPAPKFYLTPGSAGMILCRIKRSMLRK